MLVLINGSINAGRITTSKLLAARFGWTYITTDDLTDKVEGSDMYTHLDLATDLAIEAINAATDAGNSVVTDLVIREKDYARLEHEIHTQPLIFITLSPSLKEAQGQRGDRVLPEWETKGLQAPYADGIASPDYGRIIDNSNLTADETVDKIMQIVETVTGNDSSLQRFLDKEGRLLVWPKKQDDKELVLAYLATKFEFNTSYHEREVNGILKEWHTFSDWPLLRRELFERSYVDRNRSGTDYQRLK